MKMLYTTDRLILGVLKPEDANIVLDYYKRNKHFLEPWEPMREPSFYTEECQKRLLDFEYKKILNGSSFRLWIFKKEDYKTYTIGNFGFNNIIRGAFQSCFLGYKLDEKNCGRGYMTEALAKGIEIAFKDLKLHRIEANIIPRNEKSINLISRLGFREEGLAKKYLNINGVWEDHYHYALTREDINY